MLVLFDSIAIIFGNQFDHFWGTFFLPNFVIISYLFRVRMRVATMNSTLVFDNNGLSLETFHLLGKTRLHSLKACGYVKIVDTSTWFTYMYSGQSEWEYSTLPIWSLLEVFETDLMIQYSPDLVTEPKLTWLKNEFTIM